MEAIIKNFVTMANDIMDEKLFWKHEPAELLKKLENANKNKLPLFVATRNVYTPPHGGLMGSDKFEEFSEDATIIDRVAYRVATYPEARKLKFCTLYENTGKSLLDLLMEIKNFYEVEEAAFSKVLQENTKIFSIQNHISTFSELADGLYEILRIYGANNLLAIIGSDRWKENFSKINGHDFILGTPYFEYPIKNTFVVTSGINRFVRFNVTKTGEGFSVFIKSIIEANYRNVHYFAHR